MIPILETSSICTLIRSMNSYKLKYSGNDMRQDYSLVSKVMGTETNDRFEFNSSSENQSLSHSIINDIVEQRGAFEKLSYCQLSQVILSASFVIMAKSNQEAQEKLEYLMTEINASNYEITVNDCFLIKEKLMGNVQEQLAILIHEIDGDYEIMVKAYFPVKI